MSKKENIDPMPQIPTSLPVNSSTDSEELDELIHQDQIVRQNSSFQIEFYTDSDVPEFNVQTVLQEVILQEVVESSEVSKVVIYNFNFNSVIITFILRIQ